MDAAEAGPRGRRAGAKRLLLTHIPDEIGIRLRARAGRSGVLAARSTIGHARALRIDV